MSGTDVGLPCYQVPNARYNVNLVRLLAYAMGLGARYAAPGTELVYAATRVRRCSQCYRQ
eukprot:674209-Rhodomonas_salina.2